MSKYKKIAFVIICLVLLAVSSVYTLSQDTSPLDQSAADLPLKTKKWNPGHYIRSATMDDTVSNFAEKMNNPKFATAEGARVIVSWKAIEPAKNQYNWSLIDGYLNALDDDQHLFLLFFERDLWNKDCNGNTRIPAYMLPYSTNTYSNSGQKATCVVKYWEAAPRAEMIRVLKAIAARYDNNPKFEGLMLEETAFGEIKELDTATFESRKLMALKDIHTNIANDFSRSHVFQLMNWLSTGGGPCGGLNNLAAHLKSLGHGISNPDTVPWKALPWACDSASTYTYTGIGNSSPVPVYNVYRSNTGQMPIMIGNDTSQLENPLSNPRTFNEVPMNMTNLVNHLYWTSVTGYKYKPDNINVPPLGANYLLWNSNWWSIEAGTTKELSDAYTTASSNLFSNPANKTVTGCPANIRCEAIGSITSVPPSPTTPINPTPPGGFICGKADINNDGMFTLEDLFEFSSKYQSGKNLCADTTIDYGPCGGKDVNSDGKLTIVDFGAVDIGFARRYYPKTSCVL